MTHSNDNVAKKPTIFSSLSDLKDAVIGKVEDIAEAGKELVETGIDKASDAVNTVKKEIHERTKD